jgi:hypothetical protein
MILAQLEQESASIITPGLSGIQFPTTPLTAQQTHIPIVQDSTANHQQHQ